MKDAKKWIGNYQLFVDLQGNVKITSARGFWIDPMDNGVRILRYVECEMKTVPKEIQEMAKAYKY